MLEKEYMRRTSIRAHTRNSCLKARWRIYCRTSIAMPKYLSKFSGGRAQLEHLMVSYSGIGVESLHLCLEAEAELAAKKAAEEAARAAKAAREAEEAALMNSLDSDDDDPLHIQLADATPDVHRTTSRRYVLGLTVLTPTHATLLCTSTWAMGQIGPRTQ